MCLRLEAPDRGAVEEYRIHDGDVEARQTQAPLEEDREWHRLSPEELSEHVRRGTVVAQWLTHRLGWRRLLQACVAEDSFWRPGAERAANTYRAH
jgi:hypothetical protein